MALRERIANLSLQQVLAIAFALLSIGAIFFIAAINAYSTYQSNRTFLHTTLANASQIAALRVDNYIGEITAALIASGSSQSGHLFSAEESLRHISLTRILAGHPGIRAVWSLNTEGLPTDFLSRYEIETDEVLTRLWYPSAAKHGNLTKQHFSEVRFTASAQEPLIDIAIPIVRGGRQYQGTIVATISLKYVHDLLANFKLKNRQRAYVYNSDGELIGHSDSKLTYLHNALPLSVLKDFFATNKTTSKEYQMDSGEEMIAGFSLMKQLGFGMVIETPKSEALQAALGGMLFSLIISLLVVCASILTGRWLARIIVTPVQNLSQIAEQMTNTKTASKVLITGTIETQKLGRAFNQMTQRLNATISQLESQIESRKFSQQALRESEARFRAIAENLPEVFWLGSLDNQSHFKLLYVNPAFEQVWQLKTDTVFENPSLWNDCIHPDDQRRMITAFRAFCKGKRAYDEVFRIIPPDGVEKSIRATGSLIRNEKGDIVWAAGISRDISESVKTEQTLRRSQKMDAIGRLTGGIAHDFNNILGIILGNLNLLGHEIEPDTKAHKRVITITKSAQRAAVLTRQLLRFSRSQAEQVVATNLNRIIKNMDSLITRSITPQVEIKVVFTDDLWLTAIDSGDFEDALLNLIINARDAMPDGGQLTIETHNRHLDVHYNEQHPEIIPGDYVQLLVSDSGDGIPAKQQEHIFEPFYTTKPQGKGTGLGLAMVFGFIKRSGGHIKVSSRTGIGTTFRIYLPRVLGDDQPIQETTEQEKQSPRGNEKLLVVDDEIGLLDLAQESLKSLGYEVLTADNGQKGLEILAREPDIALVFSDVVMPGGINGYELAQHAITHYPGIKVLLTSGYTDETSIKKEQEKFTNYLLSKPYSQTNLALRIRSMLGDKAPENRPKTESTSSAQAPTAGFVTGIDTLDKNHQKLLGLLDRCQAIEGDPSEALKAIVEELLAHTQPHFLQEELVMDVCGYPGLANHQQVHQLLWKQLTEKQQRSSQGVLTQQELSDFLNSWLVDHIQSMDNMIAPYCGGKSAIIAEALELNDKKPE